MENRLFRVHRHFLAENSPVLRSVFSLPRVPREAGAAVEGASDENLIYLSGATELEFETLLQFFYKGYVRVLQTASPCLYEPNMANACTGTGVSFFPAAGP